jgi:hypothetical protein
MEPTDLVQEIMARWDWDNPHVTFRVGHLHVMAHWVDGTDEDPPELTLVGPADGLMVLAYDAAVMWHSEASDHDACKVEVVEQTAHFPPSYAYALVGADAVVTVKILDYLT